MPKGGSGFKRAAGNAAKSIFGGRGGGRDWSLYNVREGVEAVQGLYGRTYRNGDVTFEYNGRGQLQNIGGKNFDRFSDRALEVAQNLAKDVRIIDREAERQYNSMMRYVGKMYTTPEERREFRNYYQGESHINVGAKRSGGDAATTARQMADKGLFTGDMSGGNVDILVAIHKEMNAVKSRISTPIPAGQREDFAADIFEGLMSRYEGVVKNAARRRRS